VNSIPLSNNPDDKGNVHGMTTRQPKLHLQLPQLNKLRLLTQLNSSQRASMDAGDKTPQCPHLSSY